MPRSEERTVRIAPSAVVRFVGDLHLGDGGRNEAFHGPDDGLSGFLHECEATCDAVVFMGDAFDLPQAFSARRILRAHPAFAQAIERLCRRRQVFFILGNHDWTVDYERLFPGARACEEIVLGDVRAMHGHQLDRYCHPDLRLHRVTVALHHLVERLFGFQFRVPLQAHDMWQNRVGHWLGCQYGRYLRRMATVYRLLGLDGRAEACDAFIAYWSRTVWGDPHALFGRARELVRGDACRALVCGHAHLPGVVDLGGRHYVNAGSWTFGAAQYVTWDGTTFRAADAATGEDPGDRHYRWMLAGHDPGDFFTWWRLHYRGWLRFRSPDVAGNTARRCASRRPE